MALWHMISKNLKVFLIVLALVPVCVFFASLRSHDGDNSVTRFGDNNKRKSYATTDQRESSPSKQVASPSTVRVDGLPVIQKPILTLFTSFTNEQKLSQIHINLLQNWVEFKPQVIPVLFNVNLDPFWVNMSLSLGWNVLNVSAQNEHGLPYLKEMYNDCQKHFDSDFYSWANGDLLFDKGLLDTLNAIKRMRPHQRTLVVGRRTNVLLKGRSLYKPSRVTQVARKEGKVFTKFAEDYFIIARNDFPWEKIAHVMIGRPGYDNYLVAIAIKHGITVVTATRTLLALHQTGDTGNFSGHKRANRNTNFNVIGKFNYSRGQTTCAQYETVFEKNRTLELRKMSPEKNIGCS